MSKKVKKTEKTEKFSTQEQVSWLDMTLTQNFDSREAKQKSDQYLKKVFDATDKNKDGNLTKGELARTLLSGDKELLESVLGKNFLYLFTKVDIDNSNNIDFMEFKRWVRLVHQEATEEKSEKVVRSFLMKVYRRLDKDSSNSITLRELTQAIKNKKLQVDVEKCLGKNFIECMDVIDYNADNKVNFVEFQDWVEVIFLKQQELIQKSSQKRLEKAKAEKEKKKKAKKVYRFSQLGAGKKKG